MQLDNIIMIGVSAGGPRTLKTFFNGMPRLKGGVVIVQHMPKFVNISLGNNLNEVTKMDVAVAKNDDRLENGKIFIAPSEKHLEIVDNSRIRLFNGEKVNFVCPAVDIAMKSLQKQPELSIIGVILTGMGKDGAEGISHIKSIGGVTFAQDEETSVIYGMPREAVNTGHVDWELPLTGIKKKVIELVGTE